MGVVWKTFQDLSLANADIHITEFWAHDSDHPNYGNVDNEQLAADQAKYICDYYTVAFGTPQVTQISYWGEGAFFSADGWKTTPAYQALYELIRKQWWTKETAQTNADGAIKTRVFHGEHRIRFTHPNGSPRSATLSVKPGELSHHRITIA